MSRRLAVLAALLLALAATPTVARADFGLVPGGFSVAALDAGGQPDLRAGGHPDRLVTDFAFTTDAGGGADGNVKDVVIDLPPGFVGDPAAAPVCPRPTFALRSCDAASQVGVMRATFGGFGQLEFPLYDLEPRADELAEFGFIALIFPVRLVISLRPDGDYGTEIRLTDLPENIPLQAAQVELWGVPADHQSGTAIPRKALLTQPTSCDGPPVTALHARSWQQPDRWLDATSDPGGPLTGCDQLPFAPSLGASLDTPTADSPSGLAIDVEVPQHDDPDARATSQVKGLAATLPGGLTLSPGVADGLSACDDSQFGIGAAGAPSCPAASQIGTAELTTTLLPAPMTGGIYFGRPLPTDRFRIFVAAAGRGLVLKLVGSLRADPDSGQLFLALDGLPALPVSRLRLHFKDGPRAPLATSPSCGPGAISASLSAYRGGAAARLADVFEVAAGPAGAGCPVTAPFAPGLVAGSSPPVGGGSGPFSLTVTRADGQQRLDRLSVRLPPGLSARLASVVRCPSALADSAACPAASRIGRAGVEAGAGASPLPLTGAAYLTGPHRGAPFGLALVLNAQAGPLQLGTVVVRTTLSLDPADARVTVTTDPLPQIVSGIPLRLRTLALDIDRPGFLLDPTSCTPTRTAAVLTSLDEAIAHASARYALGGCAKLRFAPAVSLSLGPRRELHRGGRPAVTIGLRPQAGQAAVRTATIELPLALALDPSPETTLCTRVRARDGRCPSSSVVGSARVLTPLLPHALTGTVDVVQPSVGLQPELWATVRGMGVRLSLRGTTTAAAGKPISTSFVGLPDLPLTALTLTLRGGAHGLLSVAGGLCAHGRPLRTRVGAALRGQNGGLRALRVPVHARPVC